MERPRPIQMKKAAQITVIVGSIVFPCRWVRPPWVRTTEPSFPELSRLDDYARPTDGVLLSLGRGQGHPMMGAPTWEGGGHVRDGDVAKHYEPGERLDSPSPVGKSGIDRSQAPFTRRTSPGAVSIGLQRQPIWRASIVRPSASGAISKTA